MSLATAIPYLQGKIALLTGIKAAPAYPPEAVIARPFAVCYPGEGSTEFRSSGFAHDLETIVLQIHLDRAVLVKAVEAAIPYKDLVVGLAISDPTLGGTVSVINSIDHKFGFLTFADQINIGWEFTLHVKTQITA